MKTKTLSFAFIYFSESGLFNGLRAIQMLFFLCPILVFARRMLAALHLRP